MSHRAAVTRGEGRPEARTSRTAGVSSQTANGRVRAIEIDPHQMPRSAGIVAPAVSGTPDWSLTGDRDRVKMLLAGMPKQTRTGRGFLSWSTCLSSYSEMWHKPRENVSEDRVAAATLRTLPPAARPNGGRHTTFTTGGPYVGEWLCSGYDRDRTVEEAVMALLIIGLDKHIGDARAWRDTFGEQLPIWKSALDALWPEPLPPASRFGRTPKSP